MKKNQLLNSGRRRGHIYAVAALYSKINQICVLVYIDTDDTLYICIIPHNMLM